VAAYLRAESRCFISGGGPFQSIDRGGGRCCCSAAVSSCLIDWLPCVYVNYHHCSHWGAGALAGAARKLADRAGESDMSSRWAGPAANSAKVFNLALSHGHLHNSVSLALAPPAGGIARPSARQLLLCSPIVFIGTKSYAARRRLPRTRPAGMLRD
jgi:hypothetical protein